MLHLLLKKISPEQFDELTRGAQVVTSERAGPKLLRTPDGRCVKLFRRRRRLTTGLVYPPALRFCAAARRLAQLGIATVDVEGAFRAPWLARHVVVYRELAGVTLRDALRAAGSSNSLAVDLARFLARLHAAGVYFRSIHFGNVVVLADGRLALIDLAGCKFRPWPLGVGLRARNWGHLLVKRDDVEALRTAGLESFLASYLEASGMSHRARRNLAVRLRRRLGAPPA